MSAGQTQSCTCGNAGGGPLHVRRGGFTRRSSQSGWGLHRVLEECWRMFEGMKGHVGVGSRLWRGGFRGNP